MLATMLVIYGVYNVLAILAVEYSWRRRVLTSNATFGPPSLPTTIIIVYGTGAR